MAPLKSAFFAIKPHYATMILRGTKTVELRRCRPSLQPGDIILLYASSPVRALWGWSRVERLCEASPPELWPVVREHVGLPRGEFDSYYAGATKAVAIFLCDVVRLAQPLALETIRARMPGFRVPQSFCYVNVGDLGVPG